MFCKYKTSLKYNLYSFSPLLTPSFLQELRQYVDEYAKVYDSTDEDDWRLVINEVTTFIEVGQCSTFKYNY